MTRIFQIFVTLNTKNKLSRKSEINHNLSPLSIPSKSALVQPVHSCPTATATFTCFSNDKLTRITTRPNANSDPNLAVLVRPSNIELFIASNSVVSGQPLYFDDRDLINLLIRKKEKSTCVGLCEYAASLSMCEILFLKFENQ